LPALGLFPGSGESAKATNRPLAPPPKQKHTPEHLQLLHGPYQAPPLQRGDRATCMYRDGDVIITSWSAGRISWPRCRLLETSGGGSGLLVDAELARAVRCESSLAIRYWWGVSLGSVWQWRRALGVGRLEPEGSQRLHQLVSQEGGAALQRKFAALPRKPTPPRQRWPWTLPRPSGRGLRRP
jgi:hypothetical protein